MCEVCHGLGCPACEEEARYAPCEECGGSGRILFSADGALLTPAQHAALPSDERLMDSCERCRGRGEILLEEEY
jgi:DnaJ-class molecular chaperone